MNKKKVDQSIRSDGAENYVRAILMMEFGIITYGASRNMPGYDLIACNLQHKNVCKISVKYRSAANANGFHFSKQNDYDFVIGIIGNRGKIGAYQIGTTDTVSNSAEPFKARVFIFPKSFVRQNIVRKKKERILKNPLSKKTPKQYLKYENNWYRIIKFVTNKQSG
jgi:hypothetical protein